MKDILDRIAESSPTEEPSELICRLRDCASEIEALRAKQAPAVESGARDGDAAIAACALMIKGICLTRPQEVWVDDIKSRIRYMLASLACASEAAEVPAGYKLVPVEPTVEMLNAALPHDATFGHGFKRRIYQEMVAAAPQPASEQQAAAGWVSVADRLPESGKTVLATYQNRLGKLRRIRAQYIGPKTREHYTDYDELDGEYDETTDTYYWAAGWYECIDNWGDYSHVAVSEGAVTHWMQMPDAPALAAAKGGSQ